MANKLNRAVRGVGESIRGRERERKEERGQREVQERSQGQNQASR